MLQENRLARILAEHLHAPTFGREAFVHDSVPSSQDEARRLAGAGAPHGTLVWALAQTAGRGRLDRVWISPAGAGLCFSLVLRPPLRPEAAAFLSIVAGVGIAEALRATTAVDGRLKWPNDILVGERKLGGILAEAATSGDQLQWVVLGIGINLQPMPAEAPDDVRARATSLAEITDVPFEPAELLAALLLSLETTYTEFIKRGATPIRERWIALSDTIGREVRVELGMRQLEGTAIDLGDDGSLVLRTESGSTQQVSSGEVTHLR